MKKKLHNKNKDNLRLILLEAKVAELKARSADTIHYRAKVQYLEAAELFEHAKTLIADKAPPMEDEELIS